MDSDENVPSPGSFRILLMILAPLLLGFSLIGIIDGDIFQAIGLGSQSLWLLRVGC